MAGASGDSSARWWLEFIKWIACQQPSDRLKRISDTIGESVRNLATPSGALQGEAPRGDAPAIAE